MKNKYTKLKLPKDTAWERKSWRRFVHWRITYFIDGVRNIIRWVPVLYKDRDWDDYFITKMLQKKIENQRKYLVEHNRHLNIDSNNFWMTVVLNLIEAEHEEYYSCEYMDYYESESFLSDKLIAGFGNKEEKKCNDIVVHNLQTRSADRPSLKNNKNAGGSGHLSKSDGKTYCLDTGNTQAVEIKILDCYNNNIR